MSEELAYVSDFESISSLDAEKCKDKLKNIPIGTVVKACMGTSPTNAAWIASLFPQTIFDDKFAKVGRVRIQEVEDAQAEILNAINA